MKNYLLILSVFAIFMSFSQSCKKDNNENPDEDATLFSLINESGYTYYAGTPGITAGTGNSPHGFERVRFNSIAQASLDASGKLPVGNSFPDGAVIVKEIYTSATGTLQAYALMKKNAGSSVAGEGYVWAEFNLDGSTLYSSGNKGAACISCHSGSDNRDLIRSFDLH